jgi:hypothetical protein
MKSTPSVCAGGLVDGEPLVRPRGLERFVDPDGINVELRAARARPG